MSHYATRRRPRGNREGVPAPSTSIPHQLENHWFSFRIRRAASGSSNSTLGVNDTFSVHVGLLRLGDFLPSEPVLAVGRYLAEDCFIRGPAVWCTGMRTGCIPRMVSVPTVGLGSRFCTWDILCVVRHILGWSIFLPRLGWSRSPGYSSGTSGPSAHTEES